MVCFIIFNIFFNFNLNGINQYILRFLKDMYESKLSNTYFFEYILPNYFKL